MKIRLFGIVNDSIVDGLGLRTAIFTQGCVHNCEGCHNPESHNVNGGKLYDVEDVIDLINENPLCDGITFTGGDPFLQAEECAYIAEKVNLNVWTYTGYTWEEIIQNEKFMKLLKVTDVLVDGKFELNKRSLELTFKGSSNQRIIDVKRSLELGKVMLFDNVQNR